VTTINTPAIKIEQPLGTFYAFSLNAKTLLGLTYSHPADLAGLDTDDNHSKSYTSFGTQRRENPRRLDEISRFIQSDDATFPNAIILAANYDQSGVLVDNDDARWRVTEKGGCYCLSIPENAEKASIIDGQHRLHAFSELPEDAPNADMPLLCAVFLELPTPYHAYVFATINFNQVKVPRSLAYQLFGFDVEEKPAKFWVPETAAVSIARLLGTANDSPFSGGIITGLRPSRKDDISASAFTEVSLAAIVDGILSLISKNPKHDRMTMRRTGSTDQTRGILGSEPGLPLRKFYLDDNDRAIYETIKNYFQAVSDVMWSTSDKNSYLRKTVGIQAEFDVLKKLLLNMPLTKEGLSKDSFIRRISPCSKLNALNPEYQASGIGRTKIRNDMLNLIFENSESQNV
jgi:DNA phosphorothioation-associated DGQHR protein 1